MTSIYESIRKIYDNRTYIDIHIFDVIISTVVFFTILYYIFKNQITASLINIENDWETNKCKPEYMPFAGYVSSTEGDTVYEKTIINYKKCMSGLLKTNFEVSFVPFVNSLKAITNTMAYVASSIANIEINILTMESSVSDIFADIQKRFNEALVQLTIVIVNIKATIGRIHGTLIATIYALIGTYYTSISGLMFMSNAWYTFIMAAFIGAATIMMLVPFTYIFGFALFAQGLLLAVPLIVLDKFIKEAFGVKMTNRLPKLPKKKKFNLKNPFKKCFAPDTIIVMVDGNPKNISDIIVGDVLCDGSTVTSINISINDCSFVKMNGVIVTSNHKVYHNNRLIECNDHPDAIHVECMDRYVYCLGTTSKVIPINQYKFADWDEIDITGLRVLESAIKRELNPLSFEEVHTYFDTGYKLGTLILLQNGKKIPIENIKNGDVLIDGSIVTTLVLLDTRNIKYFSYFKESEYLFDGTGNLELVDDIYCKSCKSPSLSYNLVTSSGKFNISNVTVGDYNRGIERHF
jgi:hypothetical protein